jgi:hypothetical protein
MLGDEGRMFPDSLSEMAERHDIIMTEGEAHEHGKRLWALQEKGFTIKVIV